MSAIWATEDGLIEIHKAPPTVEDELRQQLHDARMKIVSLQQQLEKQANIILNARRLNIDVATALEGLLP